MEKLSLSGKSKHAVDDEMKGLSAVLVHKDEVFVDNGAVHGKSRLERGIQFVKNLDEVPNPERIWGFWITLRRVETGEQGFSGAMPFTFHIDKAAGVGHKQLSDHVNKMDKAIRGQVQGTDVPDDVRSKVAQFLQSARPDLWANATEEFRAAFLS